MAESDLDCLFMWKAVNTQGTITCTAAPRVWHFSAFHLCCTFVFESLYIASAVIMLAWLTVTLTEEISQKIDDLPVLATRRYGAFQRCSPAKLMAPLLMEALGNA